MLPAESNQIYYVRSENTDLVTVADSGGNWLQKAWNAVRDFLS